jgi:hypothetical protein
MKTFRQWSTVSVAGVGLMLAALSGCQTYVPSAGLTLPSPRYMDHPPQYTPESPPFPLSRELARMEEQAAIPPAGVLPPPRPLPAQVP